MLEPMRIACVHVGTPKTGTTAIQAFLVANWTQLLEAGICYPHAGRLPVENRFEPGQHLIPRELAASGTSPSLQAAIEETIALDARAMLLSSEEFHALLPGTTFSTLVGELRFNEFTPVGLVYLRSQTNYAESMYVELLKGGWITQFESFLAEILRDGAFSQKSTGQAIEFQYSRMMGDLERHFGPGMVIPRVYREGLAAKTLPLEVLEMVGRLLEGLHVKGLSIPSNRNASLTLRGLLLTLQLHARGKDLEIPDIPDAELDARFSLLGYEEYVQMFARFAGDNLDLKARYGIEIPLCGIADVPPSDAPRFAHARSQREILRRVVDHFLSA